MELALGKKRKRKNFITIAQSRGNGGGEIWEDP
jgi:hypothetical protein